MKRRPDIGRKAGKAQKAKIPPSQCLEGHSAPNGDDLQPLQLPISNPASHYWTSSDPHIASVDPVTGQVTAHHAGSVTITCTSDMVSGSVTLNVQ